MHAAHIRRAYTGVGGESHDALRTMDYMGGLYQETAGAATKYYAIAGMTVTGNDAASVKLLLTDHLGSVDTVKDANGGLLEHIFSSPAAVRAQVWLQGVFGMNPKF